MTFLDYPHDTTSAEHLNGLSLSSAPGLHLDKILKLARRILKEFSTDLTWYHFMNIAFIMHLEHANNNYTWIGTDDKLEGLFELFHVLEELLDRESFPQYFNPGINLMSPVKNVARDVINRLKGFRNNPTLLERHMKNEIKKASN